MADISMCMGTGCPLKEQCYRYTARPDEYRQSYFVTPPIDEEGRCDYYWSNGNRTNLNTNKQDEHQD